jgi:uncharacterized membrane protein YfcA
MDPHYSALASGSVQTTLTIAFALLLASYVKGITAMGFPLIATPMVALALDIRTAVAILVLPNLLMDLTQAFRGGAPTVIFRRFAPLLLMAIFGVFAGTRALVVLPLWILNLILGLIVIVFVFTNVYRTKFQISTEAEKFLSPLVGFGTGFLNGMTNVAGPVLAIYLYALGLKKTDFVRSIASIFIVNKAAQLAALSTWNLLTLSKLQLSLFVCAFILGGFYLGVKTQDQMSQKVFNRAVTTLILLFGVMLIVSAFR